MTDISIIIVNFRGWPRLAQCLDSLAAIRDSRFSFEVLIVDNNSGDGFLEKFRELYPGFNFILNDGNLGFANGCNLGAKNSRGLFLLFLNPDTIVSADALLGLLSEVRVRKLYSIVSCRQVRENGSEERPFGRFPLLTTITGWMRALTKIVMPGQLHPFPETEEYIYPDWVSGSVVMISRESFLALSGWDEDFWMYFEDVDLCRRARLKNGEIVLLKNVCVEHNHGGASRINREVTALTKTEVKISRHVYISKHEKGTYAFCLHFFLIINHLVLGIVPAIIGILIFFVNKFSALSQIYFKLLGYYLDSLFRGTWLSRRSVNYRFRNRKAEMFN